MTVELVDTGHYLQVWPEAEGITTYELSKRNMADRNETVRLTVDRRLFLLIGVCA